MQEENIKRPIKKIEDGNPVWLHCKISIIIIENIMILLSVLLCFLFLLVSSQVIS